MQIDKSVGNWSNEKCLSYIDDIAYKLYVEYSIPIVKHINLITTQGTIYNIHNMNNGNSFVNGFYDKALLILRREKIQKIRKRYGIK